MTAETRSDRAEVEPRSGLSHEDIRAQLTRILTSREFEATERMRSFLRFVVEETLAGRRRSIKGYTIATEVYDRGQDFDPARDPVVRTQASKIRRALERFYLTAGRADPIRIDIPKGGYVPLFVGQARGRAIQPHAPENAPRPAGPSVAVLPHDDLTGDPEQVHFASGLAEELIVELNRYRDIVAVPCRSVTTVPGTLEEWSELGAELGARFFLAGSIRKDVGAAKISTRLVDSTTGRQLWSHAQKVPLEASSLISTQEDIAAGVIATIADVLGVVAQRLSRETRQKAPTELSTYEAMLRYHHYMVTLTKEAGDRCFEALQLAIEREPEYGPAWSALANLHAHAYLFGVPELDPSLDRANRYAEKGAALEPADQLTRTIRAFLCLLQDEGAAFHEEVKIVLALNPHSPYYVGTIGFLLVLFGEFERGHDLLQQAIAAHPIHPKWFHDGCSMYHFRRREYEDALREVQAAGIAFWDDALRAAILSKLGRVAEARVTIDVLVQRQPDLAPRLGTRLRRLCKDDGLVEDLFHELREVGLEIGE